MDAYNLSQISNVLCGAEAQETGVSFAGKGEKWTTLEQGGSLLNAINQCERLIYLNLEGNSLGVQVARAIGDELENHPEFKQAFWSDIFTTRLVNEIPAALESLSRGIIMANAHLTILDCSNNAFGANGLSGLVGLLRSSSCFSLKELKLSNCGLGIMGGTMLAGALMDGLKNSLLAGTPLGLKTFIAGRNRLENEGAIALSKFFSAVKTLEHIAMPQNGIYPKGIRALSESFKYNRNMQILNLNDNTIRWRGADTLSTSFYSMPKLKEIDLGDCLLRTKGAIYLADCLQEEHFHLKVLNFSCNEIGPYGGDAIGMAMKNKPLLKHLIISGNKFGVDCRITLRRLFCSDDSDTLLDISDDDSDIDSDSYSDDNDESRDEDSNDEAYGVDPSSENGDASNQSLDSTVDGTYSSNVSVLYDSEEQQTYPITFEIFLSTPHISKQIFDRLEEGENKIADFRKHLMKLDRSEYLLQLVYAVLKCSELSQISDEACEVAILLYKDAFDHAGRTEQMNRVRTFFLTQLGLLKCEDKTFVPEYDLKACRYALQCALNRQIFSSDMQNTFRVFLESF